MPDARTDTALLHFTVADWALVALYLALLLYLGLRGRRRNEGQEADFILGGRMLTLPGFVAALVTTWYGGILGVGEFSYTYGLSNWLVFGAPYYVFALIFAFAFARKVRESGMSTIPDILYHRYGKRNGMLGSVLVFFNSSPAPYTLMLAVLIQVVTGWPLLLSLFAGLIVSVVYVFVGGFRAVVRIDKLQFLLMFLGFFMLLAHLIPEYGFLDFLKQELPESNLTVTGGHSIQYIAVWFFIALWTLVSPQFHQFTLSARTPRTARNGIIVSVGFWFVLDGITTLSGMYARALLPDLGNAAMAYPLLADMTLPAVAKALFFLGMLATVMSTNDGLMFISALTAGRDIFAKYTGRNDEVSVRRYVRVGVLFTAILSGAGAIVFPSVIELWYVIGTLFIPALLLPLAAAYYQRLLIRPELTFVAMAGGFLVSLGWFLSGQTGLAVAEGGYPLGIEPMYAGLLLSTGIYALGMLERRNKEKMHRVRK
jgi:solute:Na+ symporter, SSS family